MAEVTHEHEAGHEHGAKSHPDYRVIMLALIVVTAVELVLAEFVPRPAGTTLGGVVLAALIILSFAKIVLVAQYYMHLQSDSKWFTYIFLVPIPFMLLISVVLIIAGLLAASGA